MNQAPTPLSHDPTQVEPFEDRVAILAEELELAIRWQRPSILIAVYESEFVLQSAEAALSSRLASLGQKVQPFRVSREAFDIPLLLSRQEARATSVFFVTGLKLGGGKGGDEAYRALNLHREYFVEAQIRAVLWLTKSEAVDLPKHAPDFWAFRHRVVEFIDTPHSAGAEASLDMPSWADEVAEGEGALEGKIAFRESTLARLPEGDASLSARGDLCYALAHLYWAKGDDRKAVQHLQEGLKIAERLADARMQARFWQGMGIVRAGRGQAAQAVEADEQAVRLQPDQALSWSNLAVHFRALGKFEQALEAGNHALSLEERRAEIWNNLGNAYSDLGRLEEAESAYRSACRLAPADARPWINLGKVFADQARPRDAIRAFRKASRAASQDAEPWKRLGRVYQGLGRAREARKAFEKADALEAKARADRRDG